MSTARNHHRPVRLTVPPKPSAGAIFFPSTPSTTPLLPIPSARRSASSRRTFASALVLLLSLRSLYSLLPVLRSSSPSFSLFSFSFIFSLLSSISLSLLPYPPSSSSPLSKSHLSPLLLKSSLLSLSFLLRFDSLRFCAAGSSILSDFAGSLLAYSISSSVPFLSGRRLFLGFVPLFAAIAVLSFRWDRTGCSPLLLNSPSPDVECIRVGPMLLPFMSGFISFFEQSAFNWPSLRSLGRRRTHLLTLVGATALLFIPAVLGLFFQTENTVLVSSWNASAWAIGWPLLNMVLFGVLLSEIYSIEDKGNNSAKDFRRDFVAMFLCTLFLELLYSPKLSLPGFLLSGFLMWIAVLELGSPASNYVEIGNAGNSESIYALVSKPIKHIMSERKSRKIAAFLLINTAYMIVEFVAGFMSNSLGLISDACHMLFDCAALAIGLYASYIARLPANSTFNFGRGRFEVLSGYVNAVFLVLVGALIVLESIERILDPREISTSSLLSVSIGGLLVNLIGLVFFHEEHHHAHGGSTCSHSHSHSHVHDHGDSHHHHAHVAHVADHKHAHSHDDHNHHHSCRHHGHHDDDHDHDHDHEHHRCGSNGHDHNRFADAHHHVEIPLISSQSSSCSHDRPLRGDSTAHRRIDHNMEGIFLHVLADTMGSIGVVISTLLIKYKGWLVADPICSVFISMMIVTSVIALLRNSAEVLLQRVPRNLEKELNAAFDNVLRIEGVLTAHNIHIWSFTNTDIVGSLHLHATPESDKALLVQKASEVLRAAGIKDVTVQVECVKR